MWMEMAASPRHNAAESWLQHLRVFAHVQAIRFTSLTSHRVWQHLICFHPTSHTVVVNQRVALEAISWNHLGAALKLHTAGQ